MSNVKESKWSKFINRIFKYKLVNKKDYKEMLDNHSKNCKLKDGKISELTEERDKVKENLKSVSDSNSLLIRHNKELLQLNDEQSIKLTTALNEIKELNKEHKVNVSNINKKHSIKISKLNKEFADRLLKLDKEHDIEIKEIVKSTKSKSNKKSFNCEDIKKIRIASENGISNTKLSNMHKVAYSTISRIVNKQTYKDC